MPVLLLMSCPRCQGKFKLEVRPDTLQVTCPACVTLLTVPPIWHYDTGGKTFGPYAWNQLQGLAAKGELLPSHRIGRLGKQPWTPAKDLPGLFPAGGASAPPPVATPPAVPPLRVPPQPPAKPAPPKPIPKGPDVTPADDGEDSIFSGKAQPDEARGPLSIRGLRVGPRLSLNWGDFQVLKKLGAGNMGAVYLAYQKSMRRHVALKVLFKHLALQTGFVDRFYREAHTMAQLDHPNIVRCYGVGKEKGLPYFAMEYIEGSNVAAIQQALGRTFAIGDALYILLRCAEALDHAHSQQVVHRDIKPENILVTNLGSVKISDMGLAKPIDIDLSLTETGVTLGTPYYMAPEQALDSKRVEPATDIYALGGVLYHLLTGRLPFEGTTMMELMRNKERGTFAPVHELNADVPVPASQVIDKMLAKELTRRYRGCTEMIKDVVRTGLANDHLSMDVLRVCREKHSQTEESPRPRLEILFVHDSPDDIALIQGALDTSGVATNVTVMDTAYDALNHLRQTAKFIYGGARRPHMILLGLDPKQPDFMTLLGLIKNQENLRSLPFVVLCPTAEEQTLLQQKGMNVSLLIRNADDLPPLVELVRATFKLCETIVERKGPA